MLSLLLVLLADAPAPPRPTLEQLVGVVSISHAVVSPDGGTLAYVTDKSGSLELWTLSLKPGARPQQRTNARQTVDGLSFSPDGRTLLFEMDDGGNERTDLFELAVAGTAAPKRLTNTRDEAEASVLFSPRGDVLLYLADPKTPFRFNVFTRPRAGKKATQRSFESINVMDARWRNDAQEIAATVSPDDQKAEVLLMDLAHGTTRKIPPPQKDGMAAVVGYLPDNHVLLQASNAQGFLQLATLDTTTGNYAYVGPGDWDVEHVDISRSGAVVASRNVHGENEVLYWPTLAADVTPRVLWKGGMVSDLSLSDDGKTVAMVRDSARLPDGVYVWRVAEGEPRWETVVAPDAGPVALDTLQSAAVETFRSFDGVMVDALLLPPAHPQLGTPPPCVVMVHGGPNGQARDSFSATAHALSQAGFLVVAPNYRGSTGYGRAFEDLNNHDWGGGDLKDITTIVEQLGKAGRLDPRRVGIMGGSYGGYMTLRAITAAPTVFAAAVDSYGMPDLVEDYTITESRFGTWYVTEMGTPTTHKELFLDRSPIHKLDAVVTPLLVLQGANDTNVPKAESDQVVAALRKRNAVVDYTVYPNEGHGFTHRENRLDAARRTVDFMLRHLGVKAPAAR